MLRRDKELQEEPLKRLSIFLLPVSIENIDVTDAWKDWQEKSQNKCYRGQYDKFD